MKQSIAKIGIANTKSIEGVKIQNKIPN